MERVYNFSAGPSILPEEVLKRASKEMLCYRDSGMSVMEMSHRSVAFNDIIVEAESLLREIMNIPNNYKVLFLQGGASTQFSMIPLNLFNNTLKADYIDTGAWSAKAINEAKKYGEVKVLGSSKEKNYNYIPKISKDSYSKDADYCYITVNNTIYGTSFKPSEIPILGNVPLIADMSSNILSEEYDVSKFGVIFAGAQKNMGPAGVTVVIIREDLIGKAMDITPTMLNYKTHVDKNSMFNTPPTYAIYICKMVFEWIKNQGGVKTLEKINKKKARLIYNFLDNSKMFKGTVVPENRSLMNIPFITGNDDLNNMFIKEAAKNGLVNLKGHRSVGGMRASIYNAMPVNGVEKLVNVMEKFELENK